MPWSRMWPITGAHSGHCVRESNAGAKGSSGARPAVRRATASVIVRKLLFDGIMVPHARRKALTSLKMLVPDETHDDAELVVGGTASAASSPAITTAVVSATARWRIIDTTGKHAPRSCRQRVSQRSSSPQGGAGGRGTNFGSSRNNWPQASPCGDAPATGC